MRIKMNNMVTPMTVHKLIRDTNQHHLFLVWSDDSFDPPVTLVASDSIESAIDAYCENQTVIGGDIIDPANYGFLTLQEMFDAYMDGNMSGLWVDSEGNMHDIDHLMVINIIRPNYPPCN